MKTLIHLQPIIIFMAILLIMFLDMTIFGWKVAGYFNYIF